MQRPLNLQPDLWVLSRPQSSCLVNRETIQTAASLCNQIFASTTRSSERRKKSIKLGQPTTSGQCQGRSPSSRLGLLQTRGKGWSTTGSSVIKDFLNCTSVLPADVGTNLDHRITTQVPLSSRRQYIRDTQNSIQNSWATSPPWYVMLDGEGRLRKTS